jgi:hypothetical protein
MRQNVIPVKTAFTETVMQVRTQTKLAQSVTHEAFIWARWVLD